MSLIKVDQAKVLQLKRESAELSRSLFKMALLNAGYLQDVQAFVEQTSDQRIKIMWEDGPSFKRMDPELIRLASNLGYNDKKIDALFGIK